MDPYAMQDNDYTLARLWHDYQERLGRTDPEPSDGYVYDYSPLQNMLYSLKRWVRKVRRDIRSGVRAVVAVPVQLANVLDVRATHFTIGRPVNPNRYSPYRRR